MNSRELQLLRTYAKCPRIWDAAVLVPTVYSLADQGMIEPVPGSPPAYRLTAKGRQVLASEQG